ncbi:MAG TPA: glycosyltransferase [Solirubrobacteraceae bacterium]|nr:glycosyltransferase [Solirubrobacteraceae bacterium]
MAVELSYCVVNTGRRQLLHYCLDAIARERATVAFETEVLVLDNGSDDGSAEAARTHHVTSEVIALDRAQPLGANVAALLAHARGRYCLLLDEDSELEPGATAALHDELDRLPRAGAACATLVDADGTPRDSAWRLGASVRGGRGGVRRVSWARTAAMLVRRDAAARAGSFDPALDGRGAERDFCRRMRRAGYRLLLVPDARAVVHDHEFLDSER